MRGNLRVLLFFTGGLYGWPLHVAFTRGLHARPSRAAFTGGLYTWPSRAAFGRAQEKTYIPSNNP